MNNTVCFDQTKFFFTVILLIIITSFFIYNLPKYTPTEIISQETSKESTKKSIKEIPIDPNLMRDYNTVNDPLSPPTRRTFGYYHTNIPRSIPTRGHSYNYQLIGYLRRNSDNKIIKLFGRQAYPGSNNLYDYYGIFNDKDLTDVKIEIKKGNHPDHSKEIYDNDEITIDFFGNDPNDNTFIAKIYKTDNNYLQYNPFTI